eukprot:Gregarina_sp_Poly_1__2326@NODE_1620_length_3700_cov_81_161299_g1067_i0_p1_GENE_NODE_1620_length_3700_cov_81_161299_g1067_i0NODE_1620_length_3700_cov_81_161299_g1067_i0_p1_ORF_typecomplete_len376_score41_71Exo_endo_phos/PF03372_23/1_3e23_NODE_1620_length_3700_cov_81_161299_g1067_i016902817
MSRLQPKSNSVLRVCSWNILAPVYAKSDRAAEVMFPYCLAAHLDYAYRRSFIARELDDLAADILCLQECGAEVKDDLLSSYCVCHDFNFSFCPKLSKANEGLFTGWSRSRFQLVETHSIAFRESSVWQNQTLINQLDVLWPGFRDNVLSRMTAVYHFVYLKDTCSNSRILVSNTHLYWHPNASHIRTLQAYVMLVELGVLYTRYCAQDENSPIDVIVCGDLNADDRTGTIDLIENGAVPSDHVSWKDARIFASRQQVVRDEDEIGSMNHQQENHFRDEGPTLLNMLNNLLKRSQPVGELQFTTTIGVFHAVLDWIFVSPALEVVYALPGVPLSSIKHDPSETVGADKGVPPGLPSAKFPSDHIPVVIDISTKRYE